VSTRAIRVLVDLVAAFVCGVSVALILANLSSPVRPYAVLIAAVLGTGWAIAGWIKLPDDAAYVATVTLGIGFAVPLGFGVILIESGSWHPVGDMAVLLACAGLLNLLQLVRDTRRLGIQ
jgi:hypothetical protein